MPPPWPSPLVTRCTEAGGVLVLETDQALILREAAYPPVYYFPREIVDMNALVRRDAGCQRFGSTKGEFEGMDANLRPIVVIMAISSVSKIPPPDPTPRNRSSAS